MRIAGVLFAVCVLAAVFFAVQSFAEETKTQTTADSGAAAASASEGAPSTSQPAGKSEPKTDANAEGKPGASASASEKEEERKTLEIKLGAITKMKFVLIPAGEFMMGGEESPGAIAAKLAGGPKEMGTFGNQPEAFKDEQPRHKVKIEKPFYMGIHLVTQQEYANVIGWVPVFHRGPMRPVEQVSWYDARAFCAKLSAKTGMKVRLPTEAEWEYACRAGTTTAFNTGDTITTNQANYNASKAFGIGAPGNYRQTTTGVDTFPPNAWGLHDMHGNVWEWCSSLYKPYPYDAKDGREDPDAEGKRVLRGGSYVHAPSNARSAKRNANPPTDRVHDVGFRVVVETP